MKTLLRSNEARYRLARTIIQGIIGVLTANVDFLFSTFHFEPEMKAFIVALTMAILSPIMAELGNVPETQTTFNEDGVGANLEVFSDEDTENDPEE